MKIRKTIAVLLIIVMCFALVACGDSVGGNEHSSANGKNSNVISQSGNDKTASANTTPLLYKVTDKKGNVAWLFGSIHAGADYFYPLPDYVLNAFDNADSLAVEFDIVAFENDLTAAAKMLEKFVITDGRNIKDFLPSGVYEDAKQILTENGYYNIMFEYYMPVLWMSLIDEFLYEKIDVKIDLGIDKHLIDRAYEKNKEILDVESAELQYNMLSGFSDMLQAFLLEQTIEGYKNLEESKKEFDEMLKIWSKGDEKALAKILGEDVEFDTEDEKKLYNEYNNAMLVERNKNMTDWAENTLKSGKEVFICVGAAHIVGEGAMVETLRARGYTVELIGE